MQLENLKISSVKDEGPYEASKWLKVPVLLEVSEMEKLFSALGLVTIFLPGIVCKDGEGILSKEEFLEAYRKYVYSLKNNEIPDEKYYRKFFSCGLTVATDHIYAIVVNDTDYVIRINKPIVQLQFLKIDYSPDDQTFRSMVFGSNAIFWGIHFSFPQLYHDPKTKEAKEVRTGAEFPNAKLFHTIQKWVRSHTIPTPFLTKDKQINAPIRIGKECLSWINQHPQLIQKNIQVAI